jgi:ATP-binding cassette subfamily C (CFTR/MRP) protein 1
LSALDGNTEQLIVTRLLGDQGLLRKLGATVFLVTHSVRHLALADEIVLLGADGKLLAKGNYRELQSGGHLSEDILQQMQAKKEHKEDSVAPEIVAKVARPSKEQIEDLTRRVGDLTVYKYYFKSIGWRPTALFLALAAASAFGQSFSQVWLGWYTKANGHRTAFWLTGYAIIHTATLLVRLGYLWACIIKMYGASAKTLHTTLLNAVFGATQAFFTTTDTGITLNRFSQDLIVVDKDMISGVISSGAGFFQVIAMAGLVFASSTYMAAVLPLLVLVLYFLTDVYLKTSRQLRFFDLESKSPLYTHFLETLEVSFLLFFTSKPRVRLT